MSNNLSAYFILNLLGGATFTDSVFHSADRHAGFHILSSEDLHPVNVEPRKPKYLLSKSQESDRDSSAFRKFRPKPRELEVAMRNWEEAAALATTARQMTADAYLIQGQVDDKPRVGADAISSGEASILKVGSPLANSRWFLAHSEVEQSARLRVENERLREENAKLESEQTFRRTHSAGARAADERVEASNGKPAQQENMQLRLQIHNLASSLAKFRRGDGDKAYNNIHDWFAFVSVRHAQHVAMSHGSTIVICVTLGVLLVFAACFYVCQHPEDDSDSEADEDDDEWAENHLKALLDDKEQKRSCRICWCCNNTVAMFFGGVVVVSLLGGAILWEMGVLQPILSQCIIYVYITLIVAGFVSLLVAQLWRLIRRITSYIIAEFQKLRGVFRIFGHKTKYKWRDLLDDGQLNSSYQGPLGGGRGRRRSAS